MAPCRDFSLEELAVILLPWFQDASGPYWERQLAEVQRRQELRRQQERKRAKGLPVFLHIYDVSQEEQIQSLNRVLAHKYSPIKIGGVFHAGVEVLGLEWCYGGSEDETVPGVSCVPPRNHPLHHYRQTITLRRTKLSEEEIGDIISSLLEEYPGDDYDVLARNCCHFADDFCRRLQVGGIPGWLHRLARIGAGLDSAYQVAQGLQEIYYGSTSSQSIGTESSLSMRILAATGL